MWWIDSTSSQSEGGHIRVNVTSQHGLLQDLEQRLCKKQGFCLATLNLDHVVKLRQPGPFRDAYTKHTHVTADGRPIVWLSRLAGHSVQLIPGSDLMLPLIELAARRKVPIAFFGSSQDALDRAAETLLAQFPGLNIAARIAPPMGFDPQSALADTFIAQIRASGAQLVFLALGAPKQEVFATRAFEVMPQVGFASIGAGVDFIAGEQTRAPRIVRALAGVWLWRLSQDPSRLLSRYLACFAILPSLTSRAIRARLSKNSDAEFG